ncbi:BapA/Bap/LapF family large adhesin [Halomonas faecis]|uniref:BapA/Bap/LapF family large adhesin n=1 Tax=Halomonas faecis TaxID=1562110 RepID=UPI0013CFF98B|nr:BapA/Bap/LapF family large adhesin [Halomonas faecis]
MSIATVVSITGQAWARDEEGNLRELSVGDTLQEGEVLVTSDNGRVQLDFGDGLDPTVVAGGEEVTITPELDAEQEVDESEFAAMDDDIDALLAAVEEEDGDLLEALEATAAGAGGGGADGGGHSFVRLSRISEDVDPLAFTFAGANAAGPDFEDDVAPAEVEDEEVITGPSVEDFTLDFAEADLLAEGEGGDIPLPEMPPQDGVSPSLTLSAPPMGAFFAPWFSPVTQTFTPTFDFGNGGAGTIGFESMDGQTIQAGRETFNTEWDAASNTLTVTNERVESAPNSESYLLQVQVDPTTGELTVTLGSNLLHEEAQDLASLPLVFTVTDGEGNSADASFTVNIEDDMPEQFETQEGVGVAIDESPGLQQDEFYGEEQLPTDERVEVLNGAPGNPAALFSGLESIAEDQSFGLPQYAVGSGPAFSGASFFYGFYNFGADGPEVGEDGISGIPGVDFSLALHDASDDQAVPVAEGRDSGLKTTDGTGIYLFSEDGMILGRAAGSEGEADEGGDIIFALALDGQGKINVAQYASLQHPDQDDANDSVDLEGLIYGVATLTDADGDSATVANEIGGNIEFYDDAPEITAFTTQDGAELVVDESAAPSTDTDPNAGDETNADDSEAIGYATLTGDELFNIDVDGGADGENVGARSFALNLALGEEASSVDSGLDATGGGDILLSMDGSDVVGRDSESESEVFRIEINAETGAVTVTQYQAIDHGEDGNDHDAGLSIDPELLSAELTIEDNDGDSDSQSVELGSLITFEDDGPSVEAQPEARDDIDALQTADALVGEADNTDSLTLSSLFSVASSSYGADGEAGSDAESWSYSLNLLAEAGSVATSQAGGNLQSGDADVRLFQLANGSIVGSTAAEGADDATVTDNQVFTLRLEDGELVLEQHAALDHSDSDSDDYSDDVLNLAEELVELSGTVTVTDGDGDTAEDTTQIDLGGLVGFSDDGPSVEAQPEARDDIDALQTADALVGEADNTDSLTLSSLFSVASSSYGADGEAGSDAESWSYSLNLLAEAGSVATSQAGGNLQSGDADVRLFQLANGSIVGSTAAEDADDATVTDNQVFTLRLEDGELVLEQHAALDHSDSDSDDYSDEVLNLAKELVELSGTVTVTDGDGDTAEDTTQIDLGGLVGFSDDGPSVEAQPEARDDIDALQTADALVGEADNTDSLTLSSLFSVASSSYGADGEAGSDAESWSYSLNLLAEAGSVATSQAGGNLQSGDADVRLFQLANGSIVGSTAAEDADDATVTDNQVFTLRLEDGELVLEQHAALDHSDSDSDDYSDEVLNLAKELVELSGTVTVTDGDGDTAEDTTQIDLGGLVGFSDDGPSIEATQPTGHEVTIENLGSSEGVGYNNSFGYYVKGEDGQPTTGRVIWSNVKDDVGDTQVIEGYAPDDIGYFIIPDGSRLNPELGNDTEVTFEKVDGAWVATIDGESVPLEGKDSDAPVLFSDPALQPDGASHVENNAEDGHLNWEDIYGTGSDRDYNDVNVNVDWAPANLTVDEANLDSDAQYDFSGYFDTDYGADGSGSAEYSMSIVEDGADTGLVDTQSGEAVKVKMAGDGSVTGYFENAGDEVPVFTLSVDDNGVVTLDQIRAVSHPGQDLVGESDPVHLASDVVFLDKEVFDSDGDSATASIDVGGVVYFLDDGPTENDDDSAELGVSVSEIDDSFVDGDGVPVNQPVSASDSFTADWGADGPAAEDAIQFQANGGTLKGFADGATELTIDGTYGTLMVTDEGDGNYSYTYTLNADGGEALLEAETPEDVFTYMLTDGDGDSTTTELTFDIAAELFEYDPPSIGGLEGEGGDATVYEAFLEDGTQKGPADAGTTDGGQFTITAAAGVASLAFSGEGFSETFDIDALEGASESEPLTVSTTKGELSITDFTDEGDGEYNVDYNYTLNETAEHDEQGRDELLKDGITVTVEDLAGRDAADSIDVTIVDDVPEFDEEGIEDVSLSTAEDSEVTGDLNLEIGADLEGAQIDDATLKQDDDGYIQVEYQEGGDTHAAFLTSGGSKLQYEFDQDSQQLIAFKQGDSSSNPVFTIDFDVANDSYEINVIEELDPLTSGFDETSISSNGGGTAYALELGGSDLNALFTMQGGGNVNWSNTGIGGSPNNLIGNGEVLEAQFDQVLTELSFTASRGNGNPQTAEWEVYRDGQKVGDGTGNSIEGIEGGFDEVHFIGHGGANDQYRVNDFSGRYQDSGINYQLPVEVGAVDGDGDAADSGFIIGLDPVPSSIDLPDPEDPAAPSITGGEAFIDEAWLSGGTREGQGDTTQEGSIQLDAEGGIASLTVGDESLDFAALQELDNSPVSIQIDGIGTLSLTGFKGSVTGGTLSYELTLDGPVDHDDLQGRNDEDLGIDLGLVDFNGESDSGTLDLVIQDDVPEEGESDTINLDVVVDEFGIDDIDGSWVNASGGNSSPVNHLVSNGIGIVWGGSNFNDASGYKFEYAGNLDAGNSVVPGDSVSLGTFTHVNNPIDSGTAIDEVTLSLTVDTMLNGETYSVPVEVVLEHNETPNDKNPDAHHKNDDEITIKEFNVDQAVIAQLAEAGYEFSIDGFKDEDGNLVNFVSTTETESTSFELFASVQYVGEPVTAEGSISADWGADGPAEDDPIVVEHANGDSEGLDSSGQAVIEGEYGTLTLNDEGNGEFAYSFELNQAGRQALKSDGSLTESFGYTLKDADGDEVSRDITLNLTGVAAPIELVDSSADAFIDMVDHVSDPEPVMSGFEEAGNVKLTFLGFVVKDQAKTEHKDFTLNSGESGLISFDVTTTGSSYVVWSLIDESDQVVHADNRNDDGQVDIPVPEEGDYRLEVTAVGSGWGGVLTPGKALVGNIGLVKYSQAPESLPTDERNLFAEDGVSLGSNDTQLKVETDDGFEDVTDGMQVTGKYGTLTLDSDGSYTYEPEADTENLGHIDLFTYLVENAHGDSETATLSIRLDSNTENVEFGTEGADTLEGTAEDDILVGGAGDDILIGNDGADTFMWNQGDQGAENAPAEDIVKDFTVVGDTDDGQFGDAGEPNADRLDLADLLQGEDEDSIGDYIFAEEEGDNVVLHISSDGSLNGGSSKENADQKITLEGKSFSDFGGDVSDSAGLIQQMIDSGQLNIDQ